MSRISVSVFVLLLTGCATVEPWTRRDTALEVTFQALNAVDAIQTSRIENRPNVREGSPITRAVIGVEPTDTDVAFYFASIALSHYLVARALPKKWRPWFQGVTIYHTGEAVHENEGNGL